MGILKYWKGKHVILRATVSVTLTKVIHNNFPDVVVKCVDELFWYIGLSSSQLAKCLLISGSVWWLWQEGFIQACQLPGDWSHMSVMGSKNYWQWENVTMYQQYSNANGYKVGYTTVVMTLFCYSAMSHSYSKSFTLWNKLPDLPDLTYSIPNIRMLIFTDKTMKEKGLK